MTETQEGFVGVSVREFWRVTFTGIILVMVGMMLVHSDVCLHPGDSPHVSNALTLLHLGMPYVHYG